MGSLNKLEKIVKILLFVMSAVSICLITAWLISRNKANEYLDTQTASEKTQLSADTQLASKMELLPANCTLNTDLSNLSFTKENGEKLTLSELKGKTVVLSFWASWCPYCNKVLEQYEDIEKILSEFPGVELLLVNKLDNNKETRTSALEYLRNKQIPFDNVFDENMTVYKQLGLKVIPTTFVIDKQGILRAWHAGRELPLTALKSMIDYGITGGASGTLRFIENELTNEQGGIESNYINEENSNLKKTDVLSESQGLILEYAVNSSNKSLFEKSINYVNNVMRKDPLASWLVNQKKGPVRVNSAVDDLRIFRALYNADKLWGGYSEIIKNYESALYKYNTHNKNLINSYDFKYRKKSHNLKLCFADFEAMEMLAEIDNRWLEVKQNSLIIVNNGYIGDHFPMYRTEYDYRKKSYKNDDLNMAEGMVTLLHLSKIGQIKPETLKWLKEAVEGEGIFARYTTDGTVVDGYRYESTAIYGLVSMIASNAGDSDLANRAMARMESMRIFDFDSKLNGAFGNTDGTGIYSFDQCIGLLSYSVANKNK